MKTSLLALMRAEIVIGTFALFSATFFANASIGKEVAAPAPRIQVVTARQGIGSLSGG